MEGVDELQGWSGRGVGVKWRHGWGTSGRETRTAVVDVHQEGLVEVPVMLWTGVSWDKIVYKRTPYFRAEEVIPYTLRLIRYIKPCYYRKHELSECQSRRHPDTTRPRW